LKIKIEVQNSGVSRWCNKNPSHNENFQRGWKLFNKKENIVGFLYF